MIAVVATVSGVFAVDLETGDVEPTDLLPDDVSPPRLNLPRLVAAAASGTTVAAVVDTKPPLLLSYDGGVTWRASGRGLPPGRAIAIAGESPDTMVFAGRNRLYLSRDGGIFWTAVAGELPEIESVSI